MTYRFVIPEKFHYKKVITSVYFRNSDVSFTHLMKVENLDELDKCLCVSNFNPNAEIPVYGL